MDIFKLNKSTTLQLRLNYFQFLILSSIEIYEITRQENLQFKNYGIISEIIETNDWSPTILKVNKDFIRNILSQLNIVFTTIECCRVAAPLYQSGQFTTCCFFLKKLMLIEVIFFKHYIQLFIFVIRQVWVNLIFTVDIILF